MSAKPSIVVAVAVDHGGRAPRRPAARPRGPSWSSRRWVRRRAAGRRWRPARRAAPGPSCRGRARRRAGRCGGRPRRRRPPAPGACISSWPPGRPQRGRLGQRHARRWRRPTASSKDAEQRAEQLPAGERARLARCAARRRRSRGRGTGWRAGARSPTAGTTRRSAAAVGASAPAARLLGLGLDAGGVEHLALQRLGGVGDDGVLGEQLEERRVAGGRLGQDRRDAVEALELLGRAGPRCSSLSALIRARSSRTSRATTWNMVRSDGAHRAALDPRLDLAHLAGEDRDDAFVVARAGTLLVPLRRTTTTRLTSALTSHSLLLRSIRRTYAHRTTSARTHGRCDRASYGTGLDVAVPRRGPRI